METQQTQHNTLHARLSQHLQRHQYTKGRHAGAAPADSSRRARTHFRVELRPTHIAVVFHATDIICAYPDGSVTLNAARWDASPTTRDAFAHWGFYLRSVRHGGHAQTTLGSSPAYAGPTVPFENGLKLMATGPGQHKVVQHRLHPDYKPKPFMARVADRVRRKAFRDHPTTKEFRSALPVLHAALTAMPSPEFRELKWQRIHIHGTLDIAIQNPANWPAIIARHYTDTPEGTWTAICTAATAHMTMLVEVL